MLIPPGEFRRLGGELQVSVPDGDAETGGVGLHAGVGNEVIVIQIGDEVPNIGAHHQFVVEEGHLLFLGTGQPAPKPSFIVLVDSRDGHPVSF